MNDGLRCGKRGSEGRIFAADAANIRQKAWSARVGKRLELAKGMEQLYLIWLPTLAPVKLRMYRESRKRW